MTMLLNHQRKLALRLGWVLVILWCQCALTNAHEEGILRLQLGTATKGTLEIFHSGLWGSICHDGFTDKSATVACQQMGLGNVGVVFKGAHFGSSTSGFNWLSEVSCTGSGSEVDLLSCPHADWLAYNCTPAMDVGIECQSSYAYRIVNGPTPNAGRVEIQGDGRWLTVCDVGFDINAANVTCNYLGYSGAISYHPGAQFGNGTEDIHYMGLICNGNENSLAECQHTVGNGDGVCSLADVVGVTCQGGPIRIISTTGNPDEGILQIYHAGQWGMISDYGIDDTTAKVACNILGYGYVGYMSPEYYLGASTFPMILFNMYCHGNETNLVECPHSNWVLYENYPYASEVYCRNYDLTDVRLVDGSVDNEGRIEILVNGNWGTVCDDGFRIRDADVFCRMLGYRRAEQFYHLAYFGQGTGEILANYVDCTGEETHLLDCSFVKGDYHCSHLEDVSVKCFYLKRCHDQWVHPDTSNFTMARYLTDQSNYTEIVNMTTRNKIGCVRQCNTQARETCGEPNECSMVTFDDVTRSCTLYHLDEAATATITCDGTATCYKHLLLE